jgi:hypothetical protein
METLDLKVVAKPPRRRFRLGIRGLLGIILLVGLALGWFSWQDRLARRQTALLQELKQVNVHVNNPYPTRLCWFAMKILGKDSRATQDLLARWLDPGWMLTPRGFNAGMLTDSQVAGVVDRISQFGNVKEVRFDQPPNKGLRLFYVENVPYERLGAAKSAVTVTDHSTSSLGETR